MENDCRARTDKQSPITRKSTKQPYQVGTKREIHSLKEKNGADDRS